MIDTKLGVNNTENKIYKDNLRKYYETLDFRNLA
jgi:hypothetical protein